MSDVILQADDVWKQYGVSPIRSLAARLRGLVGRIANPSYPTDKLWALQGVSFELRPGETLGVIGRNGAGKSTLLKLLSGVTSPTRGRVGVHGRMAPLIEVGAGFHPEMSGRENIYFNAAILGMGPHEIRRKFDAIVAFSELERFLDVPVKKYSSGMFVRLGFSVAVHTEPDLLLVDEVLSVGDAAFQRKCFDAIRALLARGSSLVLVSHAMPSVQSVCKRVIWLDQGKVRSDGPADAVIASYCEDADRQYLAAQQGGTDCQSVLPAGTPNEPIRLERLVLRGEGGTETDTIRSGSTVELELHYFAKDRIPRPFVWLGVSQNQFGSLFGFSNLADRNRAPCLEGRGVLRVRVPSLPLMPGIYQITGGVRDETASILLTESRVLRTFQVVMTAPGLVGDLCIDAGQAYDSSPVIVPFEWLGDECRLAECAEEALSAAR